MEKILNIAGGKLAPLDIEEPYFVVNVDTMYYLHTEPAEVEKAWIYWDQKTNRIFNVKEDVFTFLERTAVYFDRVCIYRFLEHVSFTQVLYFIYLISTVTPQGATVDIIVPNYDILAERILQESSMSAKMGNFEAWNIELTTELLNEPSCPHASIWTPHRAKYFWELEKRFVVEDIDKSFEFDGRDLYLRFKARRL